MDHVLVVFNLLFLIVFPFSFLIWLIKKKEINSLKFILDWMVVGIFVVFYYQAAFWPYASGYYTRYLIVSIFIICSLVILFKYRRIKKIPATLKNYIFASMNIVIIVILSCGIWMVKEGKQEPERKVELEFPLKGKRYYVAQGGSNEAINHHFSVSAQKYALDICQLTPWGLRAYSLFPAESSSYTIFGQNLYSPCTGTIVEAVDQYPDQFPSFTDSKHPAGNFLAIRTKDDRTVILLAHLQKGSLQKQIGDSVQQGEFIAKVGNSGNTTEPHLHIHAVDSASSDYLFDGEGIAIVFNGKFYTRNDLISTEKSNYAMCEFSEAENCK